MKLFIYGAAVALAATPTFAAKKIVMESTDLATNKITQREILIDTARLRVNDGNTSIMFLTSGGNRMVILDKTRNEYRVLDQQTVDQLAAQLQGASAQMEAAMKNIPPEQRAMMEKMLKGKMPVAAAAPAAVVFTAKGSGMAGGYACTKYDGMRGAEKVVDLCAAQAAALKLAAGDSQVYQKMQEFTAGMTKAMQNSPLASAMSIGGMQGNIQGFPVEETMYSGGKATRKEVLKSLTDVAVTDADFSTGNAKQMEMLPNASKARK